MFGHHAFIKGTFSHSYANELKSHSFKCQKASPSSCCHAGHEVPPETSKTVQSANMIPK